MKRQEHSSLRKVVERLESVLAELQTLDLPAGAAGSALLDILEILGGIRARTRIRAKALLSKAPAALPGWSVTSKNPRGRSRAAGEIVPVRSYERENSLKLFRVRKDRPFCVIPGAIARLFCPMTPF
jgi:hypothetical protein